MFLLDTWLFTHVASSMGQPLLHSPGRELSYLDNPKSQLEYATTDVLLDYEMLMRTYGGTVLNP